MLIWLGAGLSILGMIGIIASIFMVARAKKAKLPDEEMRTRIAKILPINMGALFVSMIGLMMVIIDIIFI